VVADESDTRVFLFNLLKGAGFEAVVACNMSEGLDIAESILPALIILDVMMTDKKGILMYHHLKNDAILKTVPVIMLSAIDRKTFYLYEKFYSPLNPASVPEPDAYIEKPPEADELVHTVRTLTAAAKGRNGDVTRTRTPESSDLNPRKKELHRR
jgi:DNA-binding response OmpR family regulator